MTADFNDEQTVLKVRERITITVSVLDFLIRDVKS